jgi:hypothetical protein
MKPLTVTRLAWSVCALALILTAGAYTLAVVGREDFAALDFPLVGASSAVVGGLVASRRPGNPVGWLFLGGALAGAIHALAAEYAVYGIVADPGSLPLAWAAAGLARVIEPVGPVLFFILLPLYFPNGRPVSPRWSLVGWITVGLLPVGMLLQALTPGETVYASGIPNPLAVEALRPVGDLLGPLLLSTYIVMIFASAASLVVRLLRSAGEERQQLKWFTYAAAFIPVWFLLNPPVERAFPNLFGLIDSLVIAAVPVAAGVAILRYRLYDIDRIINRTLVYGALTAVLAALYLGGVVVLQYALRWLTGGESQIAVVASTLAIAALFNPLRRRIQAFIDRRFYRQKYDAAKTLEAFSAKLRDETDLDALSGEVVAVIRETLEPEHASLWLRAPTVDRGVAR